MTNTYCLDACALIAYIKNEEGADIVENVLDQAAANDAVVYISAVNLSEVIYSFRREKNDDEMYILWQRIHNLPVTIVREITDSIIDEAARLKSRNKISHADSLGIAVAKNLSATFVTSDHHELEIVEEHESISFLWLPPKPKKQQPLN
ncbi:MAG: type II toxin-antitoxin system VapC family toxin [Treponema sp.]|nr:type II toxin-antitoxin system VapC family toxin [Treponema sp.]